MGILAQAADERVAGVELTEDSLSVALKDGRTITVPLAWYPRLSMRRQSNERIGRLPAAGTAFIGQKLTKT